MDSKWDVNYSELSGFDLAMIWLLIRPANKTRLKTYFSLLCLANTIGVLIEMSTCGPV